MARAVVWTRQQLTPLAAPPLLTQARPIPAQPEPVAVPQTLLDCTGVARPAALAVTVAKGLIAQPVTRATQRASRRLAVQSVEALATEADSVVALSVVMAV